MMEPYTISRQVKVYSMGALIGVVSGITAVMFRLLILGLNLAFVTIPSLMGAAGWIVAPILGGLAVAFIVVRYAPEAKGHGVPEVIESYVLKDGKMRLRVPLLKSLASAICIGSGGSCGREGPIAQIGSGVGSAIAGFFKLDKNETKTLLVCGLASGIAATFNAPLGGALFGIEVLAGGIVGFSILPVILASVVATAVANLLVGASISFQSPQFGLSTPIELVLYLVLGLVLGVLSVVWMRGLYFMEDVFDKIRTSKYILPAIGGTLVGLVALFTIFLESMFGYVGAFGETSLLGTGEPYNPAIMGVGYAFIDAVLRGDVIALGAGAAIVLLIAFAILKVIATCLTLGSGGSGGVFAPTLFMGAGFGGALGIVFSAVLPFAVPQPMAFALVGMAALFAGSGRAPITCIVIIMEMTNDYRMILPLMIAVSASYLVSSFIEKESIYTMKLVRRGVNIRRGTHISALKEIKVTEIMTKEPTILTPEMTTADVFNIIDMTHHTKFPVVEDDKVIGILIAEDLFQDRIDAGRENKVRDLMNPDFLHLSPTCTMDSVLHAMMDRDEGHAVVSNPEHPERMLGYVTKADVLKAYDIAIIRLQKAGVDIDDTAPVEILDVT
ncbi:chloride channel protein [Candidatus Thorarchaeota archaeon]|nr:MAG: chloride channel protein [Candidatus Thorarchaeota archaeon]